MNRRRVIEWTKNLLIAVLIISAVFLGGRTGLFNGFFGSIPLFGRITAWITRDGAETGSAPPQEITIAAEAARPLIIVVTDGRTGHHGVSYNDTELDAAYERSSGLFAEALGSASRPDETVEGDWRSALTACGIYYEYMTAAPLPVIEGWFGNARGEELDGYLIRRCCVAFIEEESFLYFQDASTGLFYKCKTAAFGDKSFVFDQYAGNGTRFAFELGDAAPRDGAYTVLLPDAPHPLIIIGNPLVPRAALNAVLMSLGAPNRAEPYTEKDGTRVFVQTDFTIRVSPGGAVLYKRANTDTAPDARISAGAAIEVARRAAAATMGRLCGEARVVFSGLWQDDDGYTVTFSYCAAGAALYFGAADAARITVKNGQITDMLLEFKSFEFSQEQCSLIPALQELAAAGADISLCYIETGDDVLYPIWVKETEGGAGD